MERSISIRPRGTQRTLWCSRRNMTAAIICIRRTQDMRRWPIRSTSAFSVSSAVASDRQQWARGSCDELEGVACVQMALQTRHVMHSEDQEYVRAFHGPLGDCFEGCHSL